MCLSLQSSLNMDKDSESPDKHIFTLVFQQFKFSIWLFSIYFNNPLSLKTSFQRQHLWEGAKKKSWNWNIKKVCRSVQSDPGWFRTTWSQSWCLQGRWGRRSEVGGRLPLRSQPDASTSRWSTKTRERRQRFIRARIQTIFWTQREPGAGKTALRR